MSRKITICGSTGSIGRNTVDLIARAPDRYQVVALTAGSNVELLARQARLLRAGVAVIGDAGRYDDLKQALAGTGIECAAGAEAVAEAGARPADWVMSAIIGAAGLPPGLAALRQGATLALANKESLVAAGPLILAEARRHSARILPVDSEHSAVFQALTGEDIAAVERVIITASGGPFRDWTAAQLATATPAQASDHPNWDMGARITIDSASMFNKAMEIIETHEFFGIDPDRIEVLVHPQSLVHALVGFCDGALMAHVGPADMRHAIGYALNWPRRAPLPVERLDLARIATLSFEPPDPCRFPALRLAREVMAAGGLSGAAFNAAKETALDLFVEGQLGFTAMASLVETVLDRLSAETRLGGAEFSLDDVLHIDTSARTLARRLGEGKGLGNK
ncbi:1-deoxy-D-xylulose-5-phosphate reductoisomerase [Brevirhabdus sp.]|uniref:1-deoxy-D-xylulose-5-phosphate reductoisomerase n=1 Tax=Brevirhabdus sp. TaxID=2004514 RepID=UPI004058A2A0